MSVQVEAMRNLEEGLWAIDGLRGRLRANLEAQCARSDKTIMEMTFFRYRGVLLSEMEFPLLQGALNARFSIPQASIYRQVNLLLSEHSQTSLWSEFSDDEIQKIEKALLIISRTRNGWHALVSANVICFLRVRNSQYRSASHPHLYGAILIGDGIALQSAHDVAVSIVHELAHQELFLLNMIDRLVNRAFDFNEIHAPFQGKRRPPIGRLHSLWALYRMVQFHETLGKRDEKLLRLLVENASSFESNELTPFATRIVAIARRMAA